jgi:dipeptidyl aminopeptidase/acylaminoacyl peptidase
MGDSERTASVNLVVMLSRSRHVAVALIATLIAPVGARAQSAAEHFLEFPLVLQTASAGRADAFVWLTRQADRTAILFATGLPRDSLDSRRGGRLSGPDFKPRQLFAQTDRDGRPISRLAISPDGRFVVFATAWSFGEGQAFNPASLVTAPVPELWALSTDPHSSPVRIGPGAEAIFAPTGARFLYRTAAGDLHVVDLSGASASDQLLLPGAATLTDIQWSPDASAIAFVQDHAAFTFLGRYRFGDDRLTWLVTQAARIKSPVWSPDGAQLAYLQFAGREHSRTYDMTESEPLSVNVIDVDGGAPRILWKTSNRASATELEEDLDQDLRWVGDRIVFSSEHDGWSRLYAIAATGGLPVALTPAKCEAMESELVAQNALFVVHNCADLQARQASVVNVQTGAQQAIALTDVVVANASAAGRGLVAFVGGDANAAPLTRILDINSGKLVLREAPSDFGYQQSFDTPAPEIVTLQASDHVTVSAQLFLPRGGKSRHPALVFVHGGPPRQMFAAYHNDEYYARAYAFNRRLAELGYVILSVNYRSGVGYGRSFREAENRGWRGASEYQDVLAAGKWLATRADVDPKRIGIWGGSYGGLLTGQALARNSDVFAAGVAIHGVFDWSWPSPTPFHLNPAHYFGVSDETRAQAYRSSPVGAIAGWKSPLLMFSGSADMNADVLESVDLAQKLEARGVDVTTVLIPDEAHDFVRHATWVRLWQELTSFFEKHLRLETQPHSNGNLSTP